MSDSLLNEDRLTTADIANPTPRQARAAANREANSETASDSRIPLPAATESQRSASADRSASTDRGASTDRSAASVANTTTNGAGSANAPLFPDDELHNFRARWDQVQASFVDEPRKAVEQADNLVANVVKRIAEQFSAERDKLEHRWDKGDEVNTEDLRQTFRSYRSFFDRLLSF